jgi:hypothetical protein
MHCTETQCRTGVLPKDSRGSAVGTVTKIWVGRAGVRFSPGARESFLLVNVQTDTGADPASRIIGTG